MESLLKYNEKQQLKYVMEPEGEYNGIECPECGHELVDVIGSIIRSWPPQLAVRCVNCSFRDYRIT